MRILWLLYILLVSPVTKNDLVIMEREIIVSGTTSIGDFICSYNVTNQQDTLFMDQGASPTDFLFEIPVSEFSCGNFLINNDFRRTIKAREYPSALVKVSRLRKNNENYTCDLFLEIAGKRMRFEDFNLFNSGDQIFGDLVLSFQDLDLDPPRKFGGLIQVDEHLYLSLALTYR